MRIQPALLLLFVSAAPVPAAVVEYQFSGVVEIVSSRSPPLDDIVRVGDKYTATFIFDTTALDLLPQSSYQGSYTGPSAVLSLPGLLLQSSPSQLFVHARAVGGDSLRFIGQDATFSFGIYLDCYAGTALASDGLPGLPPAAFPDFADLRELGVIWQTGSKFGASIDSIIVVPEAGTFVLFVLGGLALKRRDR